MKLVVISALMLVCIAFGAALVPVAERIDRLFHHHTPSEAGASIDSAPAFTTMRVSAYCPCEICCGEFADGITASGGPAVGRICAADPSIPFGTVLDIEGLGEYVVQDRGGAIKGDRIDILMDSHGKAILFGVQLLEVR